MADWNTMASSAQRKFRSSSSDMASTSTAGPERGWYRTWPPATTPGGRSSLVTA